MASGTPNSYGVIRDKLRMSSPMNPKQAPRPGDARPVLREGNGVAVRVPRQGAHLPMRRARILRPIDSCITQLKAQGPFRTCKESKEDTNRTRFRPGQRQSTSATIAENPETRRTT